MRLHERRGVEHPDEQLAADDSQRDADERSREAQDQALAEDELRQQAPRPADGEEQSQEGSFELCEGGGSDASALIGKAVVFTTQVENVLAASCQGDMDCGQSDSVEVIQTITAAP